MTRLRQSLSDHNGAGGGEGKGGPDDQRVLQALDTLEQALRAVDMWSAGPPPIAALESRMPFCCDTLSLQLWLQWVLAPRLRALIEAGAALPARSNIAPYAEVVWPAAAPYDALVAVLRDLDAILSQN